MVCSPRLGYDHDRQGGRLGHQQHGAVPRAAGRHVYGVARLERFSLGCSAQASACASVRNAGAEAPALQRREKRSRMPVESVDMLIEQEDQVAVAAIRSAVPEFVAIYRFGSSVSGGQSPGSDVDLAVLAATPLDPLRRFDLQERLASALRRGVDLVDLRVASPVMAMQVIGKGRLLLDTDASARGRFEDLTYGVYARFNEERRGILQRVAAEGTVYGR